VDEERAAYTHKKKNKNQPSLHHHHQHTPNTNTHTKNQPPTAHHHHHGHQRSGRSITLREVYRLALKQFPTAVKFWREWLEHELRLGGWVGGWVGGYGGNVSVCVYVCVIIGYIYMCVRVRHRHPRNEPNPPPLFPKTQRTQHNTGHVTEADALFRRCLLEVPHVDLFLLYLQRIRRANPAAAGDGWVSGVSWLGG
jgi:hypothetical protein